MSKPSSSSSNGAASAPFSDAAGERSRKLEWRCRRGMKELDLLLLRYLRGRYPDAEASERHAFEEFLELPDPDIARYLIAGHDPENPAQAEICRHILQSN